MGRFFALAILLAATAPAQANPLAAAAPVESLHLRDGIERAEADGVVAKLVAAQHSLTEGQAYFHLLAGAPASYPANSSSPRESFLALDWSDLRFVQRMETGSERRRGYRLSVMPDGLGQLYWDVRVTLEVSGAIERVEMFYGPPAPF
jgi:hypothetical protein